jgi:hypothetical protein
VREHLCAAALPRCCRGRDYALLWVKGFNGGRRRALSISCPPPPRAPCRPSSARAWSWPLGNRGR